MPNKQFFIYIKARTSHDHIQWNDDDIHFVLDQGQKRIKCVFTVTCQKNLGSVGRDFFFFFFFLLSAKPEIVVPGSVIRYFIFEIFGKLSFIAAVLWRIMQFFYLLCSQFRQKASSWINKTLLLVRQQIWLSELYMYI
jgi:hypothetical protein